MSEIISDNNQNSISEEWDTLSEVPFNNGGTKKESLNAGEPWVGPYDSREGINENEPDIDGVPQTAWRGERYYLDNIDELGKRNLSTKGHEDVHNMDGKVHMARDMAYASRYAIGTDGVTWYDEALPVEKIPIGVIFKINNSGNHLNIKPTSPEPDDFGPFAGKHREFIIDEVSVDDYAVQEIYIMDDFIANGGKGHQRSDFRRPMEVFKVKDQSEVPEIVEKVKRRMTELDAQRKI